MPEVIMPVEWVEIDMICDKCGKGKMRSGGRTFTVNPPIFPHVCNKCGYEADYRTCYPHTGYTRKELEAERDAAVKWLEEYKSKTYCAYCGAIFNIDSDASHVSEHIRTCPHHPMRELEAENDELDRIAVTMCRQKNELEAENERLREALKYIAFTTPGPTMKTHSEAAEQALKEASDDDFKDKKEAR